MPFIIHAGFAWSANALLVFSLLLNAADSVAAPADDFVTTWKTDNPGYYNDSSIYVPIEGGPYDVDWDNDGAFDEFGLKIGRAHV